MTQALVDNYREKLLQALRVARACKYELNRRGYPTFACDGAVGAIEDVIENIDDATLHARVAKVGENGRDL